MKQTSVEWLESKLDIILPLDFEWDRLEKAFEQAKEMEKQQIKDAYIDGEFTEGYGDDAEQYYNETFKK
jgi:hypothetical protein